MAGNSGVFELLEEILNTGRTPEEVCRDCPELLPDVRRRWTTFRHIDAEFAALLPPSSDGQDGQGIQSQPSLTELPEIPGYRVEHVLGYGGMGIVYRAWHLRLDRAVALKMLIAGPYARPDQRERFLREAQAVAALRHPNIVQIHDAGEVEGRPYFTMELVEGGDLANQIQGVPQPAPKAAELVATIAGAVHVAHESGIVHRDLKPNNILLTNDVTPKVTDFGLARRLDNTEGQTLSGAQLGTPSYMAPEQARGDRHSIGPATDIYALGTILYELLTGRPPFRSDTASATLHQAMNEEPVPPRRLNPCVPRDLETICLKCLRKEPRQRFASAADLAADLVRFLNNKSIHARPMRPLERAIRWARRNPAPAALAGGLLMTALIAFGAILWRWREADAFAKDKLAANIQLDLQRRTAVAAQERAEKANAVERWERYRSDVRAAAAALQLEISSTAERALDDAPEEHRNWEWRHLHSQLDNAQAVLPGIIPSSAMVPTWALANMNVPGRQLATVDGNERAIRLFDAQTGAASGVLHVSESKVSAMAYRPDGKTIALGCEDNAIHLWDPKTATEVAVVQGHDRPVRLLLFSHDSRRLLSLGDDKMLLWDTTTNRAVAEVPCAGQMAIALFTADGQKFVLGRERAVSLWDANTGREIATLGIHQNPILNLAVTSDGGRIASQGDHETSIRLWDGQTREEIAVLRGHSTAPSLLAFDPDGTRLVTGSPYPENAVRLWDASSGRPLAALQGHENSIRSVEFSRDGQRIVSASADRTARIWDAGTGESRAVLRGHTGLLWRAIFSPNGNRVVTCSEDRTIRLWDAQSGNLVSVLRGHKHEVQGAVFLDGGSCLASVGSDGEVRLWNMEGAELNGILRGHQSFVYDVAFSPDETHVASAAWDGTVRVWNVNTGRSIGALQDNRNDLEDHIVSSVAWHPNGTQLASVTRNNRIILWELDSSKPVRVLTAPTGGWTGDSRAVFNHAGTLLAAGSRDGSVRIWDVATGMLVGQLQGHNGSVLDVAFHPDGTRLASVGFDSSVRVWNVASGAAIAVLEGEEQGYRITYSADGSRIAASSLHGRVHIWDADKHTELAVLHHGTQVFGLGFSPDGSRLATGCRDSTIRLWDVASRKEVCELRGHNAYVHAVNFSKDGTRLASASGDNTVRIWDTVPPAGRMRRGLSRNHE